MKKAFEQVKKIFKLVGYDTNSLEDANLWAQKNLLRTGERWDKQEGTLVRELIVQNQNVLVSLLRDLKLSLSIKNMNMH